MRKLDEAFNLAPESAYQSDVTVPADIPVSTIVEIEQALSTAEKINNALTEVRDFDGHDSDMDEIAHEAMDSYRALMGLGMNVMDMAAGPVFNNATRMLEVALEAKNKKVQRKLKQVELMLKKARIDQLAGNKEADSDDEAEQPTQLDRNQLLKMLSARRL